MSDKPTTLSIDQSEWRVLFASSVQRMQEFVGQNHVLSAENLPLLLDHLDRAKVLAVAWQRAAVPAQSVEPPAPAVKTETNGAAPKRKGGWPAGKPRKRMATQAVQ